MRPKILALLLAWYGLLALGWALIGWQCAVLMGVASCVTALIVAMATVELLLRSLARIASMPMRPPLTS